jgi:hypothetical protein
MREIRLEEVLRAFLKDWEAREPTTPCLSEEALRFWASAGEVPEDVEEHLLECGRCGVRYMDLSFEAAERERWEALQAVWGDPAGLLELVADRSRDSMTRLMACGRLKEVGDASVLGRLQELREEEMDPAVDEALGEAIAYLEWKGSLPDRVRGWLESLRRVITAAWGEVEPAWAWAAAPEGGGRAVEVRSPDGRVWGEVAVGSGGEVTLRVETGDEGLRGRRVKVWLGGREVGEWELVDWGEGRYGCEGWLGLWEGEGTLEVALAVVEEETG